MNHVNTNYHVNLSQPEQVGIKCSRLLRLEHPNQFAIIGDGRQPKIQLGAWHIVPETRLPDCVTNHENNRTSIDDKIAFDDSRPIILYVHGNGGNRAGEHRGRLYKRLAYEYDYHIVTFDYRGYGDSTYEAPSAYGLTSDATYAYNWLLSQPNVNRDRVFVWGHSLGTAVAVRLVANLPLQMKPRKLILEAPFDSLASAIANHPFSTPFRLMPYFDNFFVEPIRSSAEFNFDSVQRIGDIKTTPLMILHAEDDAIIPMKLGKNLAQVASQKLGKSNVNFVQVSASLGLGHKHICTHDETMLKVKNFIG